MKNPLPSVMGILMFLMPLGGQALSSNRWHDDQLLTFLKDANRNQCIMIKKMDIKQGDNTLTFYDHIDNEEPYRQLKERPILKASNPLGPFCRGNAYTLLVDREQPLVIMLDIEKIMRTKPVAKKRLIKRVVVEQLVLWIKPLEKEEVILKRESDGYRLDLTSLQKYQYIIFDVRELNESHRMKFTLMGKNKPVSIRKD